MRTLLAAIALLSVAASPAANAAFADTATHDYAEAIGALSAQGVVEGYADGTFRPGAAINRAEFLKILLEARGEVADAARCFPDVQRDWFAKYVCAAKEEGIVSGYPDGMFRPGQDISFVEAAKILSLAYGKSAETAGAEWYEPFARALESAKAIPPSVDTLDKRLTRGEMAEMMWRISSDITDRPSKGYLNLKYPGVSIDLSAETPQKASRCEDLAAFAAQAESDGGADFFYRGMPMPAMDAESVSAPQKAGSTAGDYSGTNVQVRGVDEADIVKTDGAYIYTLSKSSQTLHIVKAGASGTLAEGTKLSVAGQQFNPQDLYVEGTRLVVIGQARNPQPMLKDSRMMLYPPAWSPSRSTARIYDIANPLKPVLKRTVGFDGTLISSRRIGDKLYMVVNQGMRYGPVPLAAATEQDLLPQFSDSASGDAPQPVARCGEVTVLPRVPSPQYLTVGVVDIDTDLAAVRRTVILGRGDTVYASEKNLYVALQDWRYRWDTLEGDTTAQQTRLFRFALAGDGARFEAKGEVEGRLLNQFSMDEHEGTFRVATTTDAQWKSAERSNNLFVLNRETLEPAGEIRNIAPGEQIYSVRFLGDRAYMVTFKTVDPLFVIDTADARNPRILGELKIPGYSTYLHPLDEHRIIGFGKEVDEAAGAELVHDPNAVHYTAVQGLKLALFDVSDVARPKEIAKQVIGDRGSDSPLLYDHRALFHDAERGILAFPASVMKLEQNPNPSGPWDKEIQRQTFQGAYVFRVSTSGFSLLGKATHYREGDCDRSAAWSWCHGFDVSRVLRIGETLFTVSDGAVQSHSLKNVETLDELRFAPENTDVLY